MRARKTNRSVKDPPAVARNEVAQSPLERSRALTLFTESPDTVRAARDMTRSALEDWGLSNLVDDARLVVSELVGNVIHHAVPDAHLATPGAHRRIDVSLRKWPELLLIGVTDEDSGPPTFPLGDMFSPHLVDGFPEALLPDCGRGLLIVQRLADSLWWCPGDAGGKTVICLFDLGGRSADRHR